MPIAKDEPVQENSKVWFLDDIKDAYIYRNYQHYCILTQSLNKFQHGDLRNSVDKKFDASLTSFVSVLS